MSNHCDRFKSPPAGSMSAEVWRLAWPAIVEHLLHTIIYFVDSLMIGQLGVAEGRPEIGISAMAALVIASPIVWSVSVVLVTTISTATVALVARAYGEGDSAKVRLATVTGLLLVMGMGGFATVLGVAFSRDIVWFFSVGKDPILLEQAARYMQIVFSTFIFAGAGMVGMSALRGAGDTRTPMVIAICANAVNVAGNYVLIFGKFGFPRMELAGAALATALTRIVEFLLVCGALFRKGSRISLRVEDFTHVRLDSVRKVFRIGFPAGLEALVVQSGYLFFTRIITGLPPASMAAHRVAISIESVSFMPAAGFQVAASTVVGQCLGARKPDLAEKGAKIANTMAMLFCSSIGIVLLAFPEAIVKLFNPDPAVVKIGALCLRIAAVAQPLLAMSMTLAGALRGAGDTKSPMYVAWLGMWCIRVPLVHLTIKFFGMGLEGAWLTMNVDWLVRSVILWFLLNRGAWKKVEL